MAKSRKSEKPDKTKVDPDDIPVKLTLTLPVMLAMRFGLHAESERLSKSDFFAKLVDAGCRKYLISNWRTTVQEKPDETAAVKRAGESDAA